jgi:hypothetical protein
VDPINTSPRYLQNTTAPATGTAPNLSAIADNTDGKSTARQMAVATGQIVARGYKAYGYLYGQATATGNTTAYLQAYIKFYDSLSPAEQQSSRYAGTRDAAVKGLAANGASATSTTATSTATPGTPATPASKAAQALSILASQAQSTARTSTNTNSGLPTTDLLTGLRSLIGVIENQQHPAPPVLKPIPNIPLPEIDFSV